MINRGETWDPAAPGGRLPLYPESAQMQFRDLLTEKCLLPEASSGTVGCDTV